MEYVILGLLLLRKQTLYELNNAFKRSISLFYSASYGSLQTALKKLESKGLIEFVEQTENGRRKKIYAALPEGKAAFLAWMHGETPENKLEVTALSKIYLLGLIEDAGERRSILQEIFGKMNKALAQLEALDRELEHTEVSDGHRDIFHYQLRTLEYGMGTHRLAREWIAEMLRDLDGLPAADRTQ